LLLFKNNARLKPCPTEFFNLTFFLKRVRDVGFYPNVIISSGIKPDATIPLPGWEGIGGG